MTTLADRTITALRAEHELLAGLIPGLADNQLIGPSGASEWKVADVLSHLGSGAEIMGAGLQATLGQAAAPPADFNQGVWDRWNALPPREQADGFLDRDAALVTALEGLGDDQRESLGFSIGFGPDPLPVASFAGMRLNEMSQHSWDVRVALDPDATIIGDSAEILLEQFAGGLGFLLGFVGKPADGERIVLGLGASGYTLVIDDAVSLTGAAGDATATFSGAPEAAVRLIAGRLTPEHTPEGLEVAGNTSLEDLRRIFPGY